MGFRLESVHAFVCIDDDGDEGVIGETLSDGTMMPFIAGDAKRVEILRPMAKKIGRIAGKEIRLVRFSQREDLGPV